MSQEYFLEVRGLKKYFEADRASLFSREPRFVHAVDDVSFNLNRGEVIALVGESGCGKSTLSLLLMGLEDPTAGSIMFDGRDITHLNDHERKSLRRKIQMVFQDPYESLNPTQTIEEIINEPLLVHGIAKDKKERSGRVIKAMEDAGLKPAEVYLNRFPHELSGGQRQRVVIAAALVLEPEILLADEPVSMLDVSIRAEIINLLAELRITRQIAVIFITHDLGSVGFFADRVAVMYLGRIVEIGAVLEILESPQHPYTKACSPSSPSPTRVCATSELFCKAKRPIP